MKITKAYLKKLIKEEIAVMEGAVPFEFMTAEAGDFLEIEIDSTGRERSIEKIEKEKYENTITNYMTSLKALVQVVEIVKSEDFLED